MARQTHSSLDHAGVRILFCFPITPTKESPRVTHSHPHAKIHTHSLASAGVDFWGREKGSKGDAVETHTRILERYQRGNWLQDQQKTLPISAALSADVRSQNLRRMHSCSLFARLCVYFLFAPSLMPLSTEPWIAPLCLQPPIWRRSPPRAAHTHWWQTKEDE